MRKRSGHVAALALLSTLIASGMPAARAAFPGANGLIAFRRGSQIFTMNGDGSDQKVVPNTEFSDQPAFSADGNRIAFVSDGDIWIVSPSGAGLRNLTKSPDNLEAEPTWSPDGTEIAFERTVDGNTDVYVARSTDAGGVRRLTTDTNFDGYPVWSPDGDLIAFTSNRRLGYGIHTIPADGSSTETFIVSTSVINVYQQWFPDGSKLAYQSQNELWVADRDGSNQTQLTNGATTYFGMSVSPDGTKIAFTSARDSNFEVYVADADGSNQVNITNSPDTDDRLPDWGVPGDGSGDGGVQNGTDDDDDLTGTSSSDTVFAGAGDDVITTLGGADVVFGEEGSDQINGGAGKDKLYGDFGPSGSSAAVRRGRVRLLQDPGPGDDILKGGGGDDLAVGGPGGDKLNGGPGIDRMKGGPGVDTCVFSSKRELDLSSSCEKKQRSFQRSFRP
jgi:Ca2+-binding RTX toxin-like protein